MGVRFDVVCPSVVVVLGLGCAQGAPEPDGLSGPIVLGTTDAAIAAAVPVDAGSPMAPASAPPTFKGTACKMGDEVPCTCGDGTKGSQSCRFDAASPTMGALGSCEGCKAPTATTPNAGSGSADMTSAGSGGAGGSGAPAGSGAAGSRAAGSGGSAAAGSGGSAAAGSGGSAAAGSGGSAAAGSGGSAAGAMACDPDKCPDPGGLRRACCTDDGQCGGRLLGIGNCSVRN